VERINRSALLKFPEYTLDIVSIPDSQASYVPRADITLKVDTSRAGSNRAAARGKAPELLKKTNEVQKEEPEDDRYVL
jgi:hypothetical protein